MATTKSHIKWERSVENRAFASNKKPTVHYTYRVPGCDFYLNIYSHESMWCWTVRSRKRSSNVFANGWYRCKTLKQAKIDCAKWAVIHFLRLMHPNIVKGEPDGGHLIYWFQPLDR
jgi:hypothetical protein